MNNSYYRDLSLCIDNKIISTCLELGIETNEFEANYIARINNLVRAQPYEQSDKHYSKLMVKAFRGAEKYIREKYKGEKNEDTK